VQHPIDENVVSTFSVGKKQQACQAMRDMRHRRRYSLQVIDLGTKVPIQSPEIRRSMALLLPPWGVSKQVS
jgi:hypothetical protein